MNAPKQNPSLQGWQELAMNYCANPGITTHEMHAIALRVARNEELNFDQFVAEVGKLAKKIYDGKNRSEVNKRVNAIIRGTTISMQECDPAEPQDYHPRANLS